MKSLVCHISLGSKDFSEKVLYSLNRGHGVTTTLPGFIGSQNGQKDFDAMLFLLGNGKVSERRRCPACNAFHWHFVKEEVGERDASMICNQCGNLLHLLKMFKVDDDRILEWLKSYGEMCGLRIAKEAMDRLIAEGKIMQGEMDFGGGQ